jgi:rare lipoprotein A (peptidoglycan hydrolase)
MTAAMVRELAPRLPTHVWVVREDVQPRLWIRVRVNDRGPFERRGGRWVRHSTRVIDLSHKGMQQLRGLSSGIIPVSVHSDSCS